MPEALKRLPNPVTSIRGPAARSDRVKAAPDANPDEGVWGWVKYHSLPNFAPEGTDELRSRLCGELSP